MATVDWATLTGSAAGILTTLEWGTVGEWVAGLGALAAAVVAVCMPRWALKREAEDRARRDAKQVVASWRYVRSFPIPLRDFFGDDETPTVAVEVEISNPGAVMRQVTLELVLSGGRALASIHSNHEHDGEPAACATFEPGDGGGGGAPEQPGLDVHEQGDIAVQPGIEGTAEGGTSTGPLQLLGHPFVGGRLEQRGRRVQGTDRPAGEGLHRNDLERVEVHDRLEVGGDAVVVHDVGHLRARQQWGS